MLQAVINKDSLVRRRLCSKLHGCTVAVVCTPPVVTRGVPSEYCYVWCGKTRMVWLHADEKFGRYINLFVSTESTNLIDRLHPWLTGWYVHVGHSQSSHQSVWLASHPRVELMQHLLVTSIIALILVSLRVYWQIFAAFYSLVQRTKIWCGVYTYTKYVCTVCSSADMIIRWKSQFNKNSSFIVNLSVTLWSHVKMERPVISYNLYRKVARPVISYNLYRKVAPSFYILYICLYTARCRLCVSLWPPYILSSCRWH